MIRTRIQICGALACLLLISNQADAQGIQLLSIDGDATGDNFGSSVSNAGDVNNDGYDDIILGAPELDQIFPFGIGYARVISGLDGSVIHDFAGLKYLSAYGLAVSGAGDLDGDGFDDVVIGAPNDYATGGSSSAAGIVRTYSGVDKSLIHTWYADAIGDSFGYSVSSAGDVDGDGVPDVIVGAPLDDNQGLSSGSARVFSGQDGSVLYTFNGHFSHAGFGWIVSSAGDVDADGHDDLIVGSSGEYARVHSGRTGGLLYEFSGVSTSDDFGTAVAGAGDVDLDGHDDFIIGARSASIHASAGGMARVYSGADGSVMYEWAGTTVLDLMGRSVSSAGDVNVDGHPDLLVGCNGFAKVFSGKDGTEIFMMSEDTPYNGFALAVSGAGDFNGDGRSDVVIGIPSDDGNGSSAGGARVYSMDPTVTPQNPSNYCIGLNNSTGQAARIAHEGTVSMAANDLHLRVFGAVPLSHGQFFYGAGQAQQPFGDGVLCVSGTLFRLPPASLIDSFGSAVRWVDYHRYPSDEGAGMITPGSTWNFQFWYRDLNSGSGTMFNFTDALSATFEP